MKIITLWIAEIKPTNHCENAKCVLRQVIPSYVYRESNKLDLLFDGQVVTMCNKMKKRLNIMAGLEIIILRIAEIKPTNHCIACVVRQVIY